MVYNVKLSNMEIETSREYSPDALENLGKSIFIAKNTDITVSWDSDSVLKILYTYNPSKTDIVIQEKSIENLKIDYVLNFKYSTIESHN